MDERKKLRMKKLFLLKTFIVILLYSIFAMGLTKTDLYTEEVNEIAGLMKALAHPARVAIVNHLLKVNSCICGDIVNELSLAQPTVSQHLKELKSYGIIKGEIEGTSICYCLNMDAIEKIYVYLSSIKNTLKQKSNCC